MTDENKSLCGEWVPPFELGCGAYERHRIERVVFFSEVNEFNQSMQDALDRGHYPFLVHSSDGVNQYPMFSYAVDKDFNYIGSSKMPDGFEEWAFKHGYKLNR